MRQGRTARRPQGPRPQTPFPRTHGHPRSDPRRSRTGRSRATGRRSHHRQPQQSAIGTLVERTTRFTILLHLPDGHDAEHVQQAIIDKMQHLPKLLRNSLIGTRSGTRPAQTDPPRWTWPSTSATRTPRGSGARTRTPTGSCASTSPKAPTYPSTGGLPRRGRRGTQRPATQNPRFMKPSEKIVELLDAA